jgi:DNA-binding YbaB/EbfC family protein
MAKSGFPKGMMQQIQQMQQQLLKAQEDLANEVVSATAGGGAVKIAITGDQRCTAVEIDSQLIDDIDTEMLQDLVMSAVNNAMDASRELAAERLGPLAGGMP